MRKAIIIVITVAVLWGLTIYMNNTNTNSNTDGGNKPTHASPTAKKSSEELPRVGFKAPNIELRGLDDKTYSLTSLSGKPVVINFWASWCGPCRKEAPEMVSLYNKYKDKVEVYAVNLTSTDSLEGAKSFAKEFSFPFPVLLDTEGTVGSTYQVQAIPTTFFVDNNGMIIDQIVGLASPDTLENKFKKLATK